MVKQIIGFLLAVSGFGAFFAYTMKYTIDDQGHKIDVLGLRMPSDMGDMYTRSLELGYPWQYLHFYIELVLIGAGLLGAILIIRTWIED